MDDPFAKADARRLMVFGHPAHELALFGLLQRHEPAVIVLTDGGEPERVEQSRAGFASIGLGHDNCYLGFAESEFYDRLLARDFEFFLSVSRAVEAEIERLQPDQIFCDAVEFYNPVHDLTLPLVQRASRVRPKCEIYEVPLVYQVPGEEESYAIQRIPDALETRRFRQLLNAEELRRKVHARDRIYLNLRAQFGPDFINLPETHLAEEQFASAGDALAAPLETGRAMRYEWRARALRDAGAITEIITYREHFRPVVEALLAA